ncbi:iron donor protein CyaY [Kwoniella dejecticola CBS 10117]|uniref:ferroxidase n=1 Tax=Kwoniella dejecticola CBS 10117 TaxID=1296121 RepID=A0A1A5ZWV3_9TREE|nr:iron donor protein CyaY [Kwoniella dejecticola CBS 10117]OBR82289.1 iron donor protein CyaY [Kwoniella dejecticola CBS 10117]
MNPSSSRAIHQLKALSPRPSSLHHSFRNNRITPSFPSQSTSRTLTYHVQRQTQSGRIPSCSRPITQPLLCTSPSGARRFSTTRIQHTEQGEKPASTLTPEEYEQVSNRDMDILHENLEIYVEEFGPDDWEVEYSSGVMTLSLPPNGTYVINKQPPNLQIWMSSPFSGPSRFDYKTGKGWVHHRDDKIRFKELVEGELRALLVLVKQGGDDHAEGEGEGEGWQGTGL